MATKLPHLWDESDILALITDQVQESLTLDYKACDSLGRTDGKKNEASKDVSAFANSAGGTIVYGVLEDKQFPTKIDVGYDANDISKEWLEQVINSNIQRRIDGVIINQVQLPSSASGRVLYVVSIPQSMRAPHMAADHRFYKRFNFQSVPMEEYEVRDVSRRSESPDLRLHLQLPQGPDVPLVVQSGALRSSIITLSASITNDSPEPAEHLVIRIYVDQRLQPEIPVEPNLQVGTAAANVEGQPVPVTSFSVNWAVPGKMPIWEGMHFGVLDVNFTVPSGPAAYAMGWELLSPRMPPKNRWYALISNGTSVRLQESSA